MLQLEIPTHRREELIDVTREVQAAIASETCTAVVVYSPHTTAGVLINEHADPDVAHDMLSALGRIVPGDASYRHGEGNSPAHVKTSLVGTSQAIPVEYGRLALGTWQGIFLAEFDGPRQRRLVVVPVQ